MVESGGKSDNGAGLYRHLQVSLSRIDSKLQHSRLVPEAVAGQVQVFLFLHTAATAASGLSLGLALHWFRALASISQFPFDRHSLRACFSTYFFASSRIARLLCYYLSMRLGCRCLRSCCGKRAWNLLTVGPSLLSKVTLCLVHLSLCDGQSCRFRSLCLKCGAFWADAMDRSFLILN